MLRSRFLLLVAVALAPAGLLRPATQPAASTAPAAPAAPPAARPHAPPTAPPAIVRGLVTADESGRALAGATVEVFADPEPDEARAHLLAGDPIGSPLAEARTDASGRYRLEVRSKGRIVVVARSGGRERRRCGRPFVATAGRDLGECALPQGRTITGLVLDPNGAPAPGALVLARRGMAETEGWYDAGKPGRTVAFPATARTDGDGRFKVESAARAAVDLHVLAVGAAPATLAGVRRDAGIEVSLSDGRAVTGLVVDPGGAPAPRAWVLAGDDGWDGVARADEHGAFAIARVRPGTSPLVAAPTEAGSAAAVTRPAPSMALNVTVTADKAPPPVVLKLRRGAGVRVRLIDGSTRRPIAGATATLAPVEGAGSMRRQSMPDTGARRRPVDGDGVARFSGVEPGTVSVAGEADGYVDAAPRSIEAAAGSERSLTLALERAASIAGVVVDAVSGKPIAGAPLRVLAQMPNPGHQAYGPAVPLAGVEPATTPADGRFAFDRLPPSRALTLRIADPRFVPRDVDMAPLAPGERRGGIEVRLARGAVISGRVVGPGGAPLAGAEVLAERQREEDRSGGFFVYGRVGRAGGKSRDRRAPPGERELPATLTDADGRFRLAGAADGVWSLDAGVSGFAPRRVDGVRVVGGRDVDAGEVALAPGMRIRGRVSAPGAGPLALAQVGVWSQEDWVSIEVTTDSDGRFESDDLDPAARVSVSVRAEGYALFQRDGVVPSAEEMNIVLKPGSALRGRVVAADGRKPLPDFSISIARVVETSSFSSVDSEAERTFHSADGSFSIDGLTPGRTSVRATAPGYSPQDKRDVTIMDGKDLDDVVFTLTRSVTISGTVTEDTGAPLAEVLVSPRRTQNEPGAFASGQGATAQSDADGAFTLSGVEPGPVVLEFAHADFEPASQDVDATGDRQGVKVIMTRGESLTGTVVRAPGGAPVAGASVQARPVGDSSYGPQAHAVTGPDGRFVLERVAAGRYTIEAQAPGLRAGRIEGVVIARGVPPSPVEIRLEGGMTLRGRLNGIPDSEKGRLGVTVFEDDGATRGPVALDAAGAFEVAGLSPGTPNLVFGRSNGTGGFTLSRRVEIPTGVATYEVTLTVDEGRTVGGTIRRAGQPVGGASVQLWSVSRRVAVAATTDASGAWRAERVPEGETQMSISQYTIGLSYRRDVTVDGDMTLDIDLPVESVEGFVREAGSDAPLENATVTAVPAGGARSTGGTSAGGSDRTDDAGAFRIAGLDTGRYVLTARHAGHAFATQTVEIPDAGADGSGASSPVVFELEPASPLVLRVLDGATGESVRKVSCLVLSGGGDPLDPSAPEPLVAFTGSLIAGADGEFRVDTVGPGTYRVVLAAGELATETIHDLAVPAPAVTVTMVPGGTIRVRAGGLAAGTSARAVALDASGRPMHLITWTPVPYVTLRPDNPSTMPNLRPGTYRVRVALPSGTVEAQAEVKAGAITDVSFP